MSSFTIRTCWCPLLGFVIVLAASVVPAASGRAARYCEKPDPNASLAVSQGVTCATAEKVKKRLTGPCYTRTRCAVEGFRCVAYWDGRFDRPFAYTHYALCVNGPRWIVWDGG